MELDKTLNFEYALEEKSFPRRWVLATDDNQYYILRDRMGSISLRDEVARENDILHVNVGPSTTKLTEEEVFSILDSFDKINMNIESDDIPDTVMEEYNEDCVDFYEELAEERDLEELESF